MSIKKYPVRAWKKGKTVGRPSKVEKSASAFLSYELKKHESVIQQALFDLAAYGKATFEIGRS